MQEPLCVLAVTRQAGSSPQLGAGSKPLLWPESVERGHAGLTPTAHGLRPSGAPAPRARPMGMPCFRDWKAHPPVPVGASCYA